MSNLKVKIKCHICQNRGGRHAEDCLLVIGKENIDYVNCILCEYQAVCLTAHIRRIHNLSIDDYTGKISADSSFERKSKALKGKENWVARMRRIHPELIEEKLNEMGRNVSLSIMNDSQERERRADLMTSLWSTHRERLIESSSRIAIKTSKDPKVLKQRSLQLKNWRDSHYDDFIEKCTKAMISTWHSKGEKATVAMLVAKYPQCSFKNNDIIYREAFTNKSKRHQLDVVSRENKIIVEYDGPIHFKNIPSWNQLEKVQKRDEEVNAVLSKEYLVIRISYDQWHEKRGFTPTSLEQINKEINEHLVSFNPHFIKIGEAYGQSCII
jgi:hypothetical protein